MDTLQEARYKKRKWNVARMAVSTDGRRMASLVSIAIVIAVWSVPRSAGIDPPRGSIERRATAAGERYTILSSMRFFCEDSDKGSLDLWSERFSFVLFSFIAACKIHRWIKCNWDVSFPAIFVTRLEFIYLLFFFFFFLYWENVKVKSWWNLINKFRMVKLKRGKNFKLITLFRSRSEIWKVMENYYKF